MIILRQLNIKDFLSHKDTSIVFKDGDKVLLDGVSGSGKSSIIDALIWALYGVGRVENRNLVRKGSKETVVVLDLFDTETEDTYSIRRSASATGKHTINVHKSTEDPTVMLEVGTGGVKDTQRWIERDLLHASYELFINSVAYPQGNKESFVNASSARRKELLLEILKTEDIAVYAEQTKNIIRTIEWDSAAANARSVAIEVQTASINLRLAEEATLQEKKDRLTSGVSTGEKVFEEARKDLEKALATNAESSKIEPLQTQLSNIKGRVDRITSEAFPEGMVPVEHINETIGAAETKLSEIGDETLIESDLLSGLEWTNQRNSLLSERPPVRDWDSEIGELEARLHKHVMEQPDCPSGNECPYVKKLEPEEMYLKTEIAKKVELRSASKDAMAQWQEEIDKLGAAPDLRALSDKKKQVDIEKDGIRKGKNQLRALELISELNVDFSATERSLKDIQSGALTDTQLKDIKDTCRSAQDSLAATREEMAQVDGALANIEILKQDKKRLNDSVGQIKKDIVVLKERLDMFQELREAFGTNGIQAVALDYLLPAMEDRINEVLSQLSDFRVRLDTQKAGASGDTQIEGLFITIRNDQGEEFSYDSYSGGEKLKITVAISEALATLQKVGFRILDELFVGLDDESTDGFAEVLGQVQGRFSQMLCISHLRTIKDLFDTQVLVQKLDGVSKVTL